MDLLEYIKEQLGKEQISDLPGAVKKELLPNLFKHITVENFTLKQWNDTLAYILNSSEYKPVKSMEDLYCLLNKKH